MISLLAFSIGVAYLALGLAVGPSLANMLQPGENHYRLIDSTAVLLWPVWLVVALVLILAAVLLDWLL